MEIASVNAAISVPNRDGKTAWISYHFVLRADGTILQRRRAANTGDFSIWRRFKPERLAAKQLELNENLLRKVIRAFGFVPIDEMEMLNHDA